jgi:hypothetical protein
MMIPLDLGREDAPKQESFVFGASRWFSQRTPVTHHCFVGRFSFDFFFHSSVEYPMRERYYSTCHVLYEHLLSYRYSDKLVVSMIDRSIPSASRLAA